MVTLTTILTQRYTYCTETIYEYSSIINVTLTVLSNNTSRPSSQQESSRWAGGRTTRILNANATSYGAQKSTHFFQLFFHGCVISWVRFNHSHVSEVKAVLNLKSRLFVAVADFFVGSVFLSKILINCFRFLVFQIIYRVKSWSCHT